MDTAQLKTVMGGRRGGDILAYAQEFQINNAQAPGFRVYVTAWFLAVSALREREVIELGESPEPELLARFQQAWSFLISFGEHAAGFAHAHPDQAKLDIIGITVGCIEAETRLLRDNFAMYGCGMSLQEADEILKALG